MTKPFRLHLKTGERLYLNGAVVRVDRKVALELMNDATFLLEAHIMKVEDTTTPFRQMYFAIQAMLMDPNHRAGAHQLYSELAAALRENLKTAPLLDGLSRVSALVENNREFEALRLIRQLLPLEQSVLENRSSTLAHAGERV